MILLGEQTIGIEVKSGDASIPQNAVERFKNRFPDSKLVLVGKHGLPYEAFMKTQLIDLASAI